jgi:hypothetical protein
MQKVYSAATLPDAHLILGLLRQAGIEARVFNENAQGGLGEIPFIQAWPEVWVVDERDVARAREVIGAMEGADPTTQIPCSACGEANPGNFQTCWSCGEPIG